VADEIQVSGLTELRDTLLKRLPEALQGKASQKALAKAARIIVEVAKSLAPTRKPRGFVGPMQPGKESGGTLRRNIASWRNRESTKTYESRFIGVKGRAFWWRWIEFGRGAIEKASGSLGTPIKGFFGRSVKAAPARPFLRPAFEQKKFEAIEVYRQALAPAIEQVAAKARAKTVRRLVSKLTGF
jgi:HK97 gp10 family phage protein